MDRLITTKTHDTNSDAFRLTLPKAIVLMIAWTLSWRFSAILEYAPYASIWYPPAGLSFAALLVYGWRAILPIAPTAFILNYWLTAMYGLTPPASELFYHSLLFSIAHVLAYSVGALFLRQFIRLQVVQSLPAFVMAFLAMGSITALLGSFFGSQVLLTTGLITVFDLYEVWLPWWIGDLVGVLVLAPLFIGIMLRRSAFISVWQRRLRVTSQESTMHQFVFKLIHNVVFVFVLVVFAWWFEQPEIAFLFFFLALPQMWIAFTETAIRTATSLALLSLAMALGIALFELAESALIAQFALAVIASTVYFSIAVPAMLAEQERLQYQSHIDHLTKAASRSYLLEVGRDEIERAMYHHYPITVATVEISNFRAINHTFGHQAADMVLRRVADCLQGHLRHTDVLARGRGASFLVLMPETDEEQAANAVQQMTTSLHYLNIPQLTLPLTLKSATLQVQAQETIEQVLDRVSLKLDSPPT
ncbi:MAG: diguanylate cyclase [Firmicutes bacterium]|nr:diguanylate cyclase [Bacillota bacterium]